MGLFLLLLGGGLLLGWLWAGQPMLWLSLAVLLTLLGGFGLWVWRVSPRRSLKSEAQTMEAEMQQRLQALRSDPLRARYATLIEQGEPWSDEQIAYDLDPGVLNTCPIWAPSRRPCAGLGCGLSPSGVGRC